MYNTEIRDEMINNTLGKIFSLFHIEQRWKWLGICIQSNKESNRYKAMIKGKDLKKMGHEPGPVYREILQAVLDAKLNGQIKTRSDELVFVKNYVQ